MKSLEQETLELSLQLLPEEQVQLLDVTWPEVDARLADVRLRPRFDYLMRGMQVHVEYPDIPMEPGL